jgi:dephospho-CoA kinase
VKTFGVTGGIGMGKSTVAGMLAQRGVAVIDTDDLAREVVQVGKPALAEIRDTFGPAVVNPAGALDREALADVVFRDSEARKQLEAILHPRIQQLWQAQLVAWRIAGRTQAAVIIPLLFETVAESAFDLVICLACSAATQQQRLAARGWTPEQIQARLSAQLPIAEKMDRAHRVIWNEGNLEVLSRQCDRILSLPA